MNKSASSQRGEAATSRTELPLPDYDHLPTASLAHRIRMLDADGLATLLHYERHHGNRVPIISVLEARLNEVNAGTDVRFYLLL